LAFCHSFQAIYRFLGKRTSLTVAGTRPILERTATHKNREILSLTKASYISILLIALVVLCPAQCALGGWLSVRGDDTKVGSTCCSGCELPSSGTRDSIPAVPEKCNCHDCFCRGALPADDVADELNSAELVSLLAVWGKLDLSQTVAPSPQRWSRSSLFPVDASAVEARATLSCWLI
jgi:hypothetical protein